MIQLGIDLGTSTIKLAVFEDGQLTKTWSKVHYGQIASILKEGLAALFDKNAAALLGLTGNGAHELASKMPELAPFSDIPAITEGVKHLAPQAKSIIEIGSQSSRFITDLQKPAPRFSLNEHCAGGTGSFFEDQMSRLGLRIKDYSRLCEQATSVPRISGRCAVFAKTDIIHCQQEGIETPDILAGLCFAMIRNYKAAIVRDLPVQTPVAFCGGVTKNTGVIRAILETFNLSEDDLIVPENNIYASAIGAARQAKTQVNLSAFIDVLTAICAETQATAALPALVPEPGTCNADPIPTGIVPESGCTLGIDIGSTSTNLVLIDDEGHLIDLQYLRTAGNPEKAVRDGLSHIRERYGAIEFKSVGITGSGRERIGKMIGADIIRDEITAQAKSAVHWFPDADTIFEIGGQDSKYISIKNGQVADFQMNKICAAGTGSFIEEQAARMGININDFGPLALSASAPAELGERCTVFIETSIASAINNHVSSDDIAAGLCHSIVRNYLHKVVGTKSVGNHIVLQGGIAYNPAIVAAFQQAYPNKVTVSPCFSVSGAHGVALLAKEAASGTTSHFKGYDFPSENVEQEKENRIIAGNTAFFKKAGMLLLEGYDGKIDPNKKTVGVPYVLVVHKFFPMINAFFKSLGYNVLLSDATNEETIRLSQEYASGETCYPVKLIWGHVAKLIDQHVDYIFMPTVHTMKHPCSKVDHNYGCVYMQSIPQILSKSFKLKEKGIELLSPVFDLDFGQEAVASAMVSTGVKLGHPKVLCMKALMSGAMAVRKHTALVEKQGQALMANLKPDEKVLVIITRNYGISDPVLNMGIPQILLQRGHKVITLSHLPAHDLDISADHPNLYWPFGQHIISGIKMVAKHPNLYAVYLTNHGCGPDSMLSHLVRQEMGDKPYLQIEVDEHFSSVGVITRIEAFLNTLSHRPTEKISKNYDLKTVDTLPFKTVESPSKDQTLYLPDMGLYTKYIGKYFRHLGIQVVEGPVFDQNIFAIGRGETTSKEYIPFVALTGSALSLARSNNQNIQYLVPTTLGAEADGQYASVIQAILYEKGYPHVQVVAPVIEKLAERAENPDLLFRALLTADLLYAAPVNDRVNLAPENIPDYEDLLVFAEKIAGLSHPAKRIAATGTPLCLTSLNDHVLDTLEKEGYGILRSPLAEYLWFMWKENTKNPDVFHLLETFKKTMNVLSSILGKHSVFSHDAEHLYSMTDSFQHTFDGGNGRYRWAKAVEMGQSTSAVLNVSPRYENTSMILELSGIHNACNAPLYTLSIDGDWDDSAWARLRSFLYYCN